MAADRSASTTVHRPPTIRPRERSPGPPRGRGGAATLLGVAVAATAVAALLAPDGGDRGPDQPARTALPPSSSLAAVTRPVLPRPGYLAERADPVFGSTITRISDQSAFATTSRFLRHSGARRQPWNSDGSRLLLGFSRPGRLLDGQTYRFDGALLPQAAGGVWSNVDPDAFYSTRGNQLLRVDVAEGRSEVLHAFAGATSVSIGRGQGSPANDDRALALVVDAPDRTSVLNYDPMAGLVLGQVDVEPGAEGLEWAAVSQSGRHLVLNWLPDGVGEQQGVQVFDRSMTTRRALHPHSEAGDLGYDTAGREVYVTLDPAAGKAQGDQQKVVAVPLAGGEPVTVLRTDWTGTDISCRNLERPGWCYVSDADADRPRARTGGFDEIFAVRLDGSQTVQRFAHARQSPDAPDGWRTSAVPSRDGARVLWASDWLLGQDEPAYAYVASFGPR